MTRVVRNAKGAARDLEEIADFLEDREGPARADAIMDGIAKSLLSLSTLADRGHALPEAAGLGLTDILEIHYKPFRIVFCVEPKTVTVLVVADGRRDFASLLARRLLR